MIDGQVDFSFVRERNAPAEDGIRSSKVVQTVRRCQKQQSGADCAEMPETPNGANRPSVLQSKSIVQLAERYEGVRFGESRFAMQQEFEQSHTERREPIVELGAA